MSRYIILYRTDADGETLWPLLDVGERKAIAVFTSEEIARSYAQACGLLEPWQVGEMPEEEFFRWLRHSLVKRRTVTCCEPHDRPGTGAGDILAACGVGGLGLARFEKPQKSASSEAS